MATRRASKNAAPRCPVCAEATNPKPTAGARVATCSSCGNRLVHGTGEVVQIGLSAFPILDQQTMQVFDRLSALLDECKPSKLRLDFRGVQFLSSAGLGKLITLAKNAKSGGNRLVLCNVDSNIEEVLEITNVRKLFQFE